MHNARSMRSMVVLVVAFLPLFVPITAQAAIPPSERTVLLNLFAGTNGASWTTSTNWNGAAGSECTWFGVACDNSQSTVTGVDLHTNNLTGSLPADLDNLTNLHDLLVQDNHLTGPIPALTGLSNLFQFNASSNQLSGAIPALTGLVNLWAFDVSSNQLAGSIPPFTGLVNLTVFQAYNNQLSGSIPQLAGLTNLSAVTLSSNQLTGSIPALAGLANLTVLNVAQNALTGQIPPLTGLPFLVSFDASSNQLTGSIPALAGLGNLSAFFVQSNQLSGSIPALTGLPSLALFHIGSNGLTGVIPALSGAPGLIEFSVASNQLTGPIPALGALTGLIKFDVSANTLTGPLPSLAGLTNLYSFDASLNRLTGSAPALTGLSSLAVFRIEVNQLNGTAPVVPTPNALLASQSNLCPNGLDQTPDPAWDAATGQVPWYTSCGLPVVVSAVSRKVHGAAGTFDLPLNSVTTSPTTEPRLGPAHNIVFTFNKPVTAAQVAIAEGVATVGPLAFNGNDMTVTLSGVADAQYVTVQLSQLFAGTAPGNGWLRVGFLAGDVNQSRVVTVADLGLVNARLAQPANATNFPMDVNASGSVTLADKGITNGNLTRALPPP